MTRESLATLLNGREYGSEITPEEEQQAKESGLVVLFGYSDDNAEFKGALEAERGCYGGEEIYIVDGQAFERCGGSCYHCEAANEEKRARGKLIEALWCEGEGYSWTYKTDIPHVTFDVMENGEKFCRGIVFELKAVS